MRGTTTSESLPWAAKIRLPTCRTTGPVGIIRTYAYLGSNFTVDGWVNALKQGRTFMSSGPVVEFHVNKKMPGESVHLPSAGTVTMRGKVWSSTPIRLVRIYHNGSRVEGPAGRKATDFSFRNRLRWPRAVGFRWWSKPRNSPRAAAVYAQAVTNAVRVYVGDGRSAAASPRSTSWNGSTGCGPRSAISRCGVPRGSGAARMRDLDAAADVYRASVRERQDNERIMQQGGTMTRRDFVGTMAARRSLLRADCATRRLSAIPRKRNHRELGRQHGEQAAEHIKAASGCDVRRAEAFVEQACGSGQRSFSRCSTGTARTCWTRCAAWPKAQA